MKSMPRRIHCGLSFSVLVFSVLLAFTACKKQPPPQPPARGSLVSEYGNCYPYTQHGNFFNGVPATDSDYIEILVNVTSPGSYKITTDQQKGVSFSASGVFGDTGVARVHLKSSGAFTEHTYADFTTTFDSTHCFFRVPIHDSAALGIADNTFEFKAGGTFYHGSIFGVSLLLPGGDDPTTYYGSLQGFSDTSLTMNILYSVYDTLGLCYHSTNTNASFDFVTSRFSPGPKVHLTANRGQAAIGVELKIGDPDGCSPDITYFNGTVLDSAGNIVPITNARFRCSNVRQDYLH